MKRYLLILLLFLPSFSCLIADDYIDDVYYNPMSVLKTRTETVDVDADDDNLQPMYPKNIKEIVYVTDADSVYTAPTDSI